jgi:hypothetical protein
MNGILCCEKSHTIDARNEFNGMGGLIEPEGEQNEMLTGYEEKNLFYCVPYCQ